MIKLIPVYVHCHSGYKTDEYPGSFIYNGKKHEIAEITDRWHQGETNPDFALSDYFRVKTSAGNNYLLKHELRKDGWFICL